MELYWRQLPLAWLAFHPDHAEELADPLTRPVDAPIRDLCVRLLTVGGTRVAVQFADAGACWWILRDGRALSPDGLTVLPGRGNHCHTNSAAAWVAEPDRYRIQTGFGLRGGVWRRHTWLLDRDDRVFETTVPQELYFGAVLDAEQARSFAELS
ncbi:MAG: hypothetical protein ACRC8S_18880 [Fimbriiglobus sp.]